jgi:hypothetical protein
MMIVIYCLEKCIFTKNKFECYSLVAIAISVVFIVGAFAEYSWFAVFSILCLYFIKNKYACYCTFAIGNIALSFLNNNPYQIFMALAIIFFMLYNDKKPQNSLKYFFYIFYPLHLWILMLIGQFVVI